MKRVCGICEHFSSAQTCIEKPTWGYCMRFADGLPGRSGQKGSPRFTWADGVCDDFRPRLSVSARRKP